MLKLQRWNVIPVERLSGLHTCCSRDQSGLPSSLSSSPHFLLSLYESSLIHGISPTELYSARLRRRLCITIDISLRDVRFRNSITDPSGFLVVFVKHAEKQLLLKEIFRLGFLKAAVAYKAYLVTHPAAFTSQNPRMLPSLSFVTDRCHTALGSFIYIYILNIWTG
jgi:hypothetical protein